MDKNSDKKAGTSGYWAGILLYTLAWLSVLSTIFPIPLIGPSIAEAVIGTTTLTVTAGPPDATTSTVDALPASVIADGAATSTITVTVRDLGNNLIQGASVVLSSNRGAADTITQPVGTTDANGQIAGTVKSTTSGDATISAVVNGSVNVVDTAVVTFTAGPPAASTSVVDAAPVSVVADGAATSTITVTVKDVNNNLVQGATVVLSSGRGATDTITQPVGTTNAAGQITGTVKSITSGNATISAVVNGSVNVVDTAVVTFIAGPPAASTSVVDAAPVSVLADGAATSTITVTVKDANNNLVQGASAVLTSARGATDTITQPVGTTDANGQITGTVKSITSGNATMSAVVNGSVNVVDTAAVTFTAGAPSAVTSTVDALPVSVVADGIELSTLTITVRDANNNAVSGAAVIISSSRGATDTFTQPVGTTNAAGQITGTVRSITPGPSTISAVVNGSVNVVDTAVVTFTAGAPSASTSTVDASPVSLVADGTSTSTITVTVRDSNNNLVQGASVSLSSDRGATDTITQPVGTTDANGQITGTVKSITSGYATISAVVNGGVNIVDTAVVTFTAGAPSASTSTVDASPASVVADGVTTSSITVTVRDANNNLMQGASVVLSSGRGATDTITQPVGTTDANGQITGTVKSITSGDATISAVVNGSVNVVDTAVVTFIAGAPSGATTTVDALPASVVADGIELSTLTITVRDANNNAVSGATVIISSSRGATDTLTQPVGTTDANGQITGTVKSITPGASTISAVVNGSVNVVDTAVVTFTAGAPSGTSSTVDASPVSVVADGAATSTITVTVRDANNNLVQGASVTLSSVRGATDTITQPVGITDANGQITGTVKSITSGDDTISAVVNGSVNVVDTAAVTFTAGAPSAVTSTVDALPVSVVADSVTTSTITVTVRDSNNNLVQGASVTLSSGRGATDMITQPVGTTDTNGQITGTVKSITSGNATISAVVNGSVNVVDTAAVTFTAGAPSGATSTVDALPASVVADGIELSTLTITVRDANNNAVSGATVIISSSRGATDTITQPVGTTNAAGQITGTVKSVTPGTATISAVVNGSVNVVDTAVVAFIIGAPSGATSTVDASPASVVADGVTTSTITVTVRDSNNNLVQGASVTLSSDRGATDTISQPVGSTDANGQITGTVKSSTAGSATISAVVNGTVNVVDTAAVTFTVGAPSGATSTVDASPASVVADGVTISTIAVTVRDANNNLIQGASVTLSSDRGATDTISQPVGTTNAAGQITGTVKSTTVGNTVISSMINGVVNVADTTVVSFYNTPTGSNVTVSATSTSQVIFETVTGIGTTSVQDNPTGTPLINGYANPNYYEISTTATYSGLITICITYNEALYAGNENRVVLLHNETGTWVNRTSGPVDTVNNNVCGSVNSFSEFATSMTVATKLAITSLPQSVTAGQSSNGVTVEARDNYDVLDTSFNETVNLSSDSLTVRFDTSSGGSFDGSITAIIFSSGTGTIYFKDTKKGTSVITVSAAGLTSDQQAEDILAGTVNALQSTVAASPSTITANGTSTSAITVTPRDVYGNILNPGQSVSISMISGTGTLLGTVTDNGDGTYSRSVQSPTALGSGIFGAVVNTVAISQTANVMYIAGPIHHFNVTTTSPQTAGAGWTETITAEDIYNNFRSDDSSIVLLNGTGGLRFYDSNYIAEVTSASLTGGVATIYLRDNTAEAVSYTVTRQGGTESGTSGNITVNAGTPDRAVINASPTSVVANGTDSSILTITVYDVNNNPVADSTSVVVTSTIGTLNGSGTTVNGVVTRTITSTASGVAVLSVQSPPGTTLSNISGNTTVNFMPGVPYQANISASKTVVVADGADSATLTVTVRDVNGNPVADGTTVVVTTTLGSIAGSSTTLNGVVIRTITGPISGTATLGVESPAGIMLSNVTGNTSINFIAGVPSQANITASKTSVVSNGIDSATLTITVRDATGNTVADGTSVVVTSTLGTVTGTSTTLNGVVSRAITGTVSGTAVLGVESPAGTILSTLTGNTAITFTAGVPSQANISASKTTVTADGTDSSVLTVTVRDANGNLVSDGTSVAVTTTLGSVTGIGTTLSGVVTRTITGTVSGTAVLGVESPTGTPLSTLTGNTAITFTSGVPSQANISASKTSVTANGTDSATLTVTVRDVNGNLMTDGTSVVVTTTLGAIAGAGTTVNGVVTRTITGTVSGTSALGVESPTGTTLSTLTGNTAITFIPGVPSQANISASKTMVIADGVDQSALTITVRDANGNLVSDGTTVTLTATLGTVMGTGTTVSGVVTRYISSTLTGTAVLGVQSPTGTVLSTVTGNTAITFGSGSSSRAVIAASSTTITANGVDSSELTVTVYDLNNNLVADGTSVVVTSTLGTVSGSGTTVNGVVTRTITGTVSGTGVLGVQSPAGSPLSNIGGVTSIAFTAGLPSQANIVASKTSVTANGTDSATLTVTVRDANGNLVADGTSVVVTSTLGSVAGSGTTLNGVVSRTITGTVSGTAALGVQSPAGTTLPTVTGNTAITFTSGVPAQANISASKTSVTSDGTDSAALTVTVRDANGNFVIDGTSVALITTIGVITGSSTTVGGVVTRTISGTVSGAAALGVESPTGTILSTVTGNTSISFVSGAPSQANISASKTTVTANGTDSAALTVTVRDANGNMASDGTSVVVTTTLGTVSGTGTTLNGVVSRTITGTVSGMAALAVESPTGTILSTVTGNTSISFASGAPSQANISASKTTVTADGTDSAALTVTVMDANGNMVLDGTSVALTSTLGTVTGTSTTLNGVVSRTITGTVRGTAVLGVESPAGTTLSTITGNTAITFTPGVPSQANISASKTSVVADGTDSATLLVTVRDANGNLVADGTSVVLTSTLGTVTGTSTTLGGTVTRTLTGTVSGTAAIGVESPSGTTLVTISGNTSIIFTPGAPSQANIAASRTSVTADGTDQTILTITVRDAQGNLVSNGTSVTLTTDLGSVTGVGNTVNGAVTRSLSSNTAGTAALGVQSPLGTILAVLTGDTNILFNASAPAKAVIVASKITVTADGADSSTLTISVFDTNNNFVTDGTTVTVITTLGTVTGTGPTVNGVVTRTLTGTVTGTASLGVQSPTGTALSNVTGNITISFIPGEPSQANIAASKTTITADGVDQSVLTITIRDSQGNLVADGTTVTLTTTSGVVTGTSTTINGAVTRILTGTVTGTASLGVQSPAGTALSNVTGNITISFIPGVPSQANIAASKTTITADGVDQSALTITVRDGQGNLVVDGTSVTLNATLGTVAGTGTTVNGVVTRTITGTVSGTAMLGVQSPTGITISNVTGNASLNFIPGIPALANIAASRTSVTADGIDQSILTITVRDNFGNIVADGTSVTITTTLGTVTGASTTVNGIVTRTISGTIIGTAILGVESPSGTTLSIVTGNTSIIFVSGTPAKASVMASKSSVTADGTDQAILTITVRDINNNLVSDGTTVTLTSTLGAVTGSGSTVNGVVTRYLGSLTVGTALLGVQSPSGTILSTVTGDTTIIFNPGPPSRGVITASKTTLIANGTDSSLLTVTVYDANNNLAADGTSVTVNSTVGTVTGLGTTVGGVITRTLTSTVSGTAVLGIEAPTGTILSNVTGITTIVIYQGPPAQANLSASKTTITADGIDSSSITITVRDANGNLVPDGTTVKLNTTLGTVTGSGTTVSGVVTRTLSGTLSGTAALTVESPVGTLLPTVTGNTAIILEPGTPSGTITLVASPSSIEANGITASTLTSGVIRDAYGNSVSNNTLITVSASLGTITTADASGIEPGIQVLAISGVIIFTVQSPNVIGTANVTAQSVLGSASGSTQIAFVAGAPSAINSTITAATPIYSDGVSASTVTITVRDSNMNLVSGANVSLTSSRGLIDIIAQPVGVTDSSGQIIGTVASTSTGDTVISATVNGTVILSQTAGINFYNTKTGSNITVNPDSDTTVTYDMVITIGITSTTPSGTGPALPGGYILPVYVDISTTATFSGNITVCIAYNEATYGVREGLVKLLHNEGGFLVDRTTSVNTATNTVCGRVSSFSIFAISVTTATKLQITTAPQAVSAGNVSNIVTVEAQDNNGVLDPGVSGTVDVTSNSATLMLDTSSTGSFAGNTLVLNIANGTGNFYFKDTISGTPTITVTDAGAILTPATQQETISPAVPSGTIALTPSPASIVADGITTSTVTSGVITDAYGNTVSNGTLITVSTDRGTITTADADAGAAGIQVATGSGVISFVVQSGTVSGAANISAVSVQGSASGSTQITFLPGLPSGTIALTPAPASIVADGTTASTVTSGVITDAYGNTVSNGAMITVSTDRGTITTADADAGTAGIQVATVNGVISFVVQSGTVSGTANISAASVQGSASGSTQITFLPGLPSGAIALTPAPASIVADGFELSTVTSGVIADFYGNTVLDGTLVTVATDSGTITTADASGVYAGIQVATVNGVISSVVRSGTVAETAIITAFSVQGSASGSTQIDFVPGTPYGTIVLTPVPASMPADGVSLSTVTSGAIRDIYNNTVSNGTLITVSASMGTITTADADIVTPGIQVAVSGGIITFTLLSGTTAGSAAITANSVQGSATGQATITLVNVPPELNYPSETGYGSGDAVEPNSGLSSTTYRYKIVYRDVNNNPPTYVRVCIDLTPCTAMSLDTAALDSALRDGNYSNGEQYVYSINTLNPGDHVYYFETSDGLAYTKTPPSGSLNGPSVNNKPTLSFSSEAGYLTDGVDPDSGNTNVTFRFKVVYTDLDNQAPASIRLCLDSTCYSMAVDVSASAALRDGNYANGEQYIYSNTLADGTHNYYFDATDGLEGALLPQSGNLSGPIVTNTYTPVGTNVVVKPDVNVTITFDQVTATGDTYVTNSQTGSTLPSGFLHGSPPAYFDIWTTATFTGKVRICFTYVDQRYFGVGYGGERGLRWLHVEGGSFRDRTVVLDVNNNFVCGDVYSFSEFSAAVEEATLVTLTSFKATGMADKVLLTWSTAAEVDSMGFNILRGPTMTGPFTRINSWLIRSKGTPTKGMTYSFEDTGVENGITSFYKLENIDINGRISTHMIASAAPSTPETKELKPVSDAETSKPDTTEVQPPTIVIESHIEPVEPAANIKQEKIITEEMRQDDTEDETSDLESEISDSKGTPQFPVQVTKRAALDEAVKEEYPSPGDFALKIEDDKGNELDVRQAKEGDKVNEPFEAIIDDGGKVVIKWLSVGKIKGFILQRWDNKSNKQVMINTIPIPFFSSQAGEKGLLYTFRDTGVTDNMVYKYKIETILPDGSVKESKPVEITTESKKTEKSEKTPQPGSEAPAQKK